MDTQMMHYNVERIAYIVNNGDQTIATMDEMDDTPKTLSVPDAGRIYFNLGKQASYEAAKRGHIPTVKLGRTLRVPVMALERMLDDAYPNQHEEET
jgi:hypothetical protein